MGHIHLHVSDLKEAEEFYTKHLGFNVVSRFRDSAIFLSTANYHHIALNIWNGRNAPRPPKNSAGLDFYTIAYPNKEKLKKAIADLEAVGAIVESREGEFSVENSAGNRIRLTLGLPVM